MPAKRKTAKRRTTAKKKTTRKTTAARKPARKTAARKTTARKKPAARKATRKTTARKATARKTTARKATTRKTTARKAAPKPKIKTVTKTKIKIVKEKFESPEKKPRVSANDQAYSKSQTYNFLCEYTGLPRKCIAEVFEGLNELIEGHVKKRAVGTFNLPGLLKIRTVRKPATKAREGINPFTGEMTTFKAKPARTVVKVRPLKALKDMVE